PERPPAESLSTETLEILREALVPENDPYELACRLENICNVPKTVQGKTYQPGDKEKFWVQNSDTVEYRQIDATLLYVTPHTYFWAEDGAQVNQDDMKRLMDTFEAEIYPTDREFFGSEWTPGVDGDPHIYIIYTSGLGENVAGYFNSTDEFNPLIKERSNGHETFMINTTQDLGDEYTYSTLAHEFVHMIQFPADRNDATWMTEGFAEVGSFLNGYSVGGWDWAYADSPDLQLTDWTEDVGNNGTHYGQSFLYLAYFLDRFGEEATKALTNNPENDLASVDDTLTQLNITDPQTGRLITADDVFMDWAAALYLKDERVGDGRYTYHNYPDAPQASDTEVISDCPPASALGRSVNQYGIDYINVSCTGDFTLHFSGSTATGLLPVDAHSGSYAFWSNKGDESDMTLTREFDFTAAGGPIKLSYWTWYDLEDKWDYLFLEASTDGQTWEILTTPSGTADNPSGNSYGWGYTGQTGDWILEEVDLSQFAGQKVQIRFEYVTDAAVNGEGLLLDDISVEAIGYQSDFEADDGGWQAAGFVRVENVLPQSYRLALITKGDTTTVTEIPLNPDQTAEIPLSLKAGDEAILIVTGTTRFTRQPAAYQIEIR
ncbi:MAG TPA: choice-of-anchor J domain-containing protein, partial [Anaerolineales bacterium]|nr:choice-of-anchor J domain-containing protein [Anaerolineales bacterium]